MRSRFRALALSAALFACLPAFAARPEETNLAAGKRLAAAGDWKRAEEQFRLHMQAEPHDAGGVVLHAEALIHLGQPFDAVLEIEQLLASAPDHVPALKLYGALLVDVMYESSQAEPTLVRAAELAPADWQVWEALGKLYFRRHKPSDAVRCFRKSAELAPSNPEVASELARSLEEVDDAAQAEAQHRRALRLNESLKRPLATIYVRFGTFLSGRDRPEESLAAFSKALELDPKSSDAFFQRAVAEEKIGRLRAAESDALAALRESPERRDVRQLLVRVYRGLGDSAKVDEQVAAIQKLAEREQAEHARFREVRASLNAAERLLREGKYGEAIAPYEKVVELFPTFYEAYFAMGICYSQTGEPARAEAALRRYLTFQPLSADGHSALGLLFVAIKRPAEARAELGRALELNPALDEPRTALARLALDARDFGSAVSLTEPLLKRPEAADADLYLIAASARFHLNRRDEAFAICEEGLRRHPESAQLEQLHASFLIDCGRTEDCRTRAFRWYTMRPKSPHYARCMAELMVLNRPGDQATEDLMRKLVADSPSDASAHYLFARWAHARNQHAAAREEALRAAELAGSDDRLKMQCWTLAGLVEESLNDTAAAESAYRKAWDLNGKLEPPSARPAMHYVDFLLSGGRHADASARAAEVLHWDPRHGPAHLALARVLEEAGRRQEAINEAKLALGYMTEDDERLRAVHALLAKMYFALGRRDEANVHQAWIRSHSK